MPGRVIDENAELADAKAWPHIVKTLLLGQNVQRLVGHADSRPIGLYGRRKRKITRNIVEGISI